MDWLNVYIEWYGKLWMESVLWMELNGLWNKIIKMCNWMLRLEYEWINWTWRLITSLGLKS